MDIKEAEEQFVKATEERDRVHGIVDKLNARFSGKVLRGKLIENVSLRSMENTGEEFVLFSGRVLSLEEYGKHSFTEVIEDDSWISGVIGLYGGVADRSWWNTFVDSMSAYNGANRNDNNVVVKISLGYAETSNIINSSLSFTRDEQMLLKGIFVNELGLREYHSIPRFVGYLSQDVFEDGFNKVIDFIETEGKELEAVDSNWYWFFDEDDKESFVNKIVAFADNVI